MNVWIVNPFDNLPSEGNRPQRYWLMAEAFVRAGHRVTYWTSDFSHATKKRRATVRGEDGSSRADDKSNSPIRHADLRTVQIPTMPYERNVCWARVRSHRKLAHDFERMARIELEKSAGVGEAKGKGTLPPSTPPPDLVIASTPPLGLCEAAMRVAKDAGALFVCDIQDAWPETFERVLPRWVWSLAGMRAAAKRIYCGADGVSAVAMRYVELARSRGSEAPMRVFGHCIEREGTLNAKTPGRSEAQRVLRLAYAGNMSMSYDLETVIKAVRGMAGVSLDIAGNGPDRDRLVALARDGKPCTATGGCNSSNIRFHGYLGEAELAKLLRECDVGIVPMWPESCVGVPGKLADYAAAGLRVVESLGGECRAIVEKYGAGVHYAAGGVDSLKDAINIVCRPRSLASAWDPVGFAEQFDAHAVMGDYVKWIDGLVARNRPGRSKTSHG